MLHRPKRKQPLVALSWDQQQLAYALAQVTGKNKIQIRAAGTVSRLAEDGSSLPVARLLDERLRQHGTRRAAVLVGLARSQVEMIDLVLPPARDDELPELVRNNCLQHSADIAGIRPSISWCWMTIHLGHAKWRPRQFPRACWTRSSSNALLRVSRLRV
jgi:hypothetical protein